MEISSPPAPPSEAPPSVPEQPRTRSLYGDPAHYDLLAQMTAPPDIPFYLRKVDECGGPVLELACGTGRVASMVSRKGVRVVGIDRSEPMIACGRTKAEREGADIDLRCADCRDFDLGESFRLVLFPYNSLNHMLDLASIEACFAAVRRHLTRESRFVIDTFHPSLAFLSDDPERRLPVVRYTDPEGRGRVEMTEQNIYDPATQINRVIWRYCIGGVADARVDEVQMRMFFPQELDALLQLCGFAIEHKYGNYDEIPFSSVTPKQLMVCKLR